MGKEKVKMAKMYVSPEKVCGIAILCFFVFFAIYCCFFCKCDKRNQPDIRQSVETELPMTRQRGVALSYSTATPSLMPHVNATISKPPPSYEEVIIQDYRMLARGVANNAAPPTYSESVVMFQVNDPEVL